MFAPSHARVWAWLAIAALILLVLALGVTLREEHEKRLAAQSRVHQPPGGGMPLQAPVQYQVDALRQVIKRASETQSAHDLGGRAMLEAVTNASRAAAQAGANPIEQLREANRAYLTFLIDEEPYARTFFLETLAAGAEAVARYRLCREGFVTSLRAWHAHARRDRPEWPAAPDIAYEAAMGAVHDLALARIASDRTAELAGLEDDLLNIQLAILRVPDR